MTPDDPRLSPAEAGAQLRYSAKKVRLLCELGQLRHEFDRSPGGRARFWIPQSAIEEYRSRRTIRRRAS